MPEIVDRIKEDFSFEKILAQAVKVPGVKIDREEFLRKELQRFCSEDALEIAVRSNPAKAGISKEIIEKISKAVIDYESTKVTALSVAASLPSSANALAAVGAAGVDIVSYFSFVLRIVQELAYLYGFEEFELDDGTLDSGTMNTVLLFIGTMFQVQGATSSLSKLASKMAENVAKNLAKKSLTKGTIYPIVREIAKKGWSQNDKADFCRHYSLWYSYSRKSSVWRLDLCLLQTKLYEIAQAVDGIQPL